VPAEEEPIAREGEVCCGAGSEISITGTDTGIETINSGPTGDLPNLTWQDVTFTTDECQGHSGQIVTDDSGQGFPDDFLCLSSQAPPHGFIEDADTDNEQVCCGPLIMELTSQNNNNAQRPLMSRAECETVGGIMVGDIGNGAIHKEDYICESSGEAPIGAITMMASQGDAASSGEVVSASSALAQTTSSATNTIATEGEVCCASEGNSSSITENNDSDLNTITDAEEQDDEAMSRQECQEAGGTVVGDIGNGAIFEDDYVCESNGQPPIAVVLAAEGEPIASEGEVCCGPEEEMDSMSRQECQEAGGTVVGDIGNGAIFEDDYVCESNGQPPIAVVLAAEGEPIASEGEVCCGPEEETDTTLSAQNNLSAASNNNFVQVYSLMGMMAASIFAIISL
jgi:hypothetical protein